MFEPEVAPVSYTHLDVYKRQGVHKPRRQQLEKIQKGIQSLSCLLYTSHIDQQGGLVYFRLVIVAVQRAELVQGGLEPFRREHISHVQRDGHRLTRVRSLHLVLPAVLGVTVSDK